MSMQIYSYTHPTCVVYHTLLFQWVPSNHVDLIVLEVTGGDDMAALARVASARDQKPRWSTSIRICGELDGCPLLEARSEANQFFTVGGPYLLRVGSPYVIDDEKYKSLGLEASIDVRGKWRWHTPAVKRFRQMIMTTPTARLHLDNEAMDISDFIYGVGRDRHFMGTRPLEDYENHAVWTKLTQSAATKGQSIGSGEGPESIASGDRSVGVAATSVESLPAADASVVNTTEVDQAANNGANVGNG